jgi:putative DNA methylase
MTPKTARSNGKTKKEWLAQEIAKAVGAGRLEVETVDFSNPNRPKTCLEVDFPILPINQISQIESNAGKPIYQMSKWWARRRSSVFRAMLLAGAMKAPEDPAQAAKLVWDAYYANHQKKGALKNLKVADIFMGGGTTIVEGSRLGMQMFGCDLNPVAWFIVKNEMAKVDPAEVQALLAEIESEVKPQLMPFYACDCPRGHKGKWTRISTGEVMDSAFDPLSLRENDRKDYRYDGPELVYVFWAKHGPCQMTGCDHRTPIMSSPVAAVKTLSVKAWENFQCQSCSKVFDVEVAEVRMSPGVPFVVSASEKPYTVLEEDTSFKCPHCGFSHKYPRLDGKGRNKKVALSLLIHRQWLIGSPGLQKDGRPFGGSVTDDAESTCAWYDERMKPLRFLEVRGSLPSVVICPETGVSITTDEGTVPRKATFACGACGSAQDVLKTIARFGKSAPVAPYLIQGFCPKCSSEGLPYDGRFFAPADLQRNQLNTAQLEWERRAHTDLADYYPQEEVPAGLETRVRTPLDRYQYRKWKDFFNSRQMLALTQILSAISNRQDSTSKWLALAAFQQYLRLNNMFCIWDIQRDGLAPFLSKNNYQPPNRPVENSVFAELGRGNWKSCTEVLLGAVDWSCAPWDQVVVEYLGTLSKELAVQCGDAKSVKVFPGDPILETASIECRSSTDLADILPSSFDLVITDPPFGDIMQYSELSGFSYAWLKLALGKYTDSFNATTPPTAIEAVANGHRHGEDSDGFYSKVLTHISFLKLA